MDRTTVYLPSELKGALERRARELGRSEAELIREGILQVTKTNLTPRPRIPLCRSDDATLAEHVDEALTGFGEQ